MLKLIFSNHNNGKIKKFDCIIEKKSEEYIISLLHDSNEEEFVELIDDMIQPYSLEVINSHGVIADAFFDDFEENITISKKAYLRLTSSHKTTFS